MEKLYYIYLHIRKDNGTVFYVGKGTDDGNLIYERSKVTERNKWWKNITNKTEYDIQIVCTFTNESDAFQKEKELIRKYGRKDLGLGTLVNLTDGGEGMENPSDETRRKLSESRTGEKNHKFGKPTPKDVCDKISKTLTGRKLPKDVCNKMSERVRGKNHPMYNKHHRDDSKQKMREQKIGKMEGEKNHFYGKKHNVDTLKIISEKGKGRKWINNGIKSVTVSGDMVQYYLNEGWILGRIYVRK
jgi:hypothetical protein